MKVADFLRHAVSNVRNPDRKEGESLIPMRDFRKELRARMEELGMEPEFARRYLNDGFSGGEKKRMEILQLAMLQPKFTLLDETDSGLDSDAVRVVSEGIAKLSGPETGVLIITHHQRLLQINRPALHARDAGGPDCGNGRCGVGRRTAQQGLRRCP